MISDFLYGTFALTLGAVAILRPEYWWDSAHDLQLRRGLEFQRPSLLQLRRSKYGPWIAMLMGSPFGVIGAFHFARLFAIRQFDLVSFTWVSLGLYISIGFFRLMNNRKTGFFQNRYDIPEHVWALLFVLATAYIIFKG